MLGEHKAQPSSLQTFRHKYELSLWKRMINLILFRDQVVDSHKKSIKKCDKPIKASETEWTAGQKSEDCN